jgi:hypothetical protein
MSFLNDRYEIRLSKKLKEDLDKAVYNNPEQYYNKAHFLRVAIIKELRRVNEVNKK